MKNPNIQTKVVHSQTKSAWNVIGTNLGGKYKIARVPYVCVEDDEVTERHRVEALEHAAFISQCFNNSYAISERKSTSVQKTPKWIHVDTERPINERCVLLYVPEYFTEPIFGYYECGRWYNQGTNFIDKESKKIDIPVTHWMPLPQPPTE